MHYLGEENGRTYIVMDYVEGPEGAPTTLEDVLCQAEGGLPEERVQKIALQVCDALE